MKKGIFWCYVMVFDYDMYSHVIIAEVEARELIIKTFELENVKDEIKWIADNSKHYTYNIDLTSLC